MIRSLHNLPATAGIKLRCTFCNFREVKYIYASIIKHFDVAESIQFIIIV